MGETARGRLNPGRSLLLAGVILAAINLRPATTAIGPLIGEIQADTRLDAAGASLILAASLGLGLIPIVALSDFGDRVRDDRFLVVAAAASTAAGLLALLAFSSSGAIVWASLIGMGQGASFALGLEAGRPATVAEGPT